MLNAFLQSWIAWFTIVDSNEMKIRMTYLIRGVLIGAGLGIVVTMARALVHHY